MQRNFVMDFTSENDWILSALQTVPSLKSSTGRFLNGLNSQELSHFLNGVQPITKPKIPQGSPIRMTASRNHHKKQINC
ncbi:hypothetical protein SAMN06265367_11241 [Algoriphagus winogradskyi]|uniref:Uncharacterized protein n=1 Tax=Algoriphagus winogradskyi TaxID=237017 RepID=A0ABY1PKE7_9BACT|nr:hypothetical protein SAMN06265367_11241 [Algoriphagus winogradskyi]